MSHNFRRNESTSNAISRQVKNVWTGFGDLEKSFVQHEAAGISVKKDEG
jgi:hypothetical protein